MLCIGPPYILSIFSLILNYFHLQDEPRHRMGYGRIAEITIERAIDGQIAEYKT